MRDCVVSSGNVTKLVFRNPSLIASNVFAVTFLTQGKTSFKKEKWELNL